MDKFGVVLDKLATAARALANLKREVLESQKANYADLKKDDFIWRYLLQSFSTWGGVSGWEGLIENQANYERITFESLKKKRPANRVAHATAICTKAKVRYARRKGGFIVGCFDLIKELGGQRAARDQLLHLPGREAKIRFLKKFPGIGDKYARNMMMDVYHDDFRDSIAIDTRIQSISTKWDLEFESYVEHEAFYQSVASSAGLNGWELDRLMFAFQTVFHPPISIKT